MFNFLGKKKEENEAEEITEKKQSFFERLKRGLVNTRNNLSSKIDNLLSMSTKIDEELFEELEYILVSADIGANVTMELIDDLKEIVKKEKITEPSLIKDKLIELMNSKLASKELNHDFNIIDGIPTIILVVGVNGVGKTTSIGKIANKLINEGKKVIIGAGDTFRAAAIEQIEEWGKRTGAEVVKQSHGSDPSAVIFDTVSTAKNRGFDVAIIDTAGRLHNKRDLMNELEKINKIIRQQSGQEKFETLLVIDGTTGQNGLEQAKVFNEIVDLSGIILTKFDGTAKGGIIFPISEELKKPIKFIGVGEGINDLRKFNIKEFVEAMFE